MNFFRKNEVWKEVEMASGVPTTVRLEVLGLQKRICHPSLARLGSF